MRRFLQVGLLLASSIPINATVAQDSAVAHPRADIVSIRFVDAELRAVVQALSRYLDRPVLIGAMPGVRVTIESPVPIPGNQVAQVLRGLLESNGLRLHEDLAFYRVEPAGPAAETAVGTQVDAIELTVLRLRHARAGDVAATVGALFGIATGSGGRVLSSGTLSDELRRQAVAPVAGQAAQGSGEQVMEAALRGPVTIVSDELTNSLLVRATAADFATIRDAVDQLDVRPPQVLIQVIIVEARKDHLFSLGVDATVQDVAVGDGGTLSGALAGGGLGQFVLSVMRIGSFELDAALRLAVSKGEARIVSRPVLLASNNREARILVGSQRPFVQVSRSLPTDVPTRDQVVQYKEVGTKLTVLPTINADGYVALLIRQEVNSATSETQFDAPVISTREAETEVLVRDGHTVVLGGMRERQFETVRTGLPILSDLPIVGGLFGSQQRRTFETELFLFITPLVLVDDAGADAAASEALDRANRAVGGLPERQP